MELVDTLTWLVDIPSETGDEARICRSISQRLPGRPRTQVRDSLVVGSPDDRPLVVLAGHVDTVPRQGQGPASLQGGRLHGLGAADMKSGLAVMIHLLEDDALAGGPYNVAGVFYAGEEGPHEGNQLREVLDGAGWLTNAECAIVLEPSDGQLQFGCNGVVNATVGFVGAAAHSARPWFGENAITKAGEWLAAMHRLQPRTHLVDGLEFLRTVVVTRAQGGIANNIVPAAFTANVNMRFPPGMSIEEAVAELRDICEAADTFSITDTAPAGAVADHPLLRRLAELSGAERAAKQGWTDVARFGEVAVPAVNFGPGSAAQAHQADEWVEVASMEEVHRSLRLLLAG